MSSIPKKSMMFKHILIYLKRDTDTTVGDTIQFVKTKFDLPKEIQNQSENTSSPFGSRVLRALTHLRKSELIVNKQPGVFHLSDVGARLCKNNPLTDEDIVRKMNENPKYKQWTNEPEIEHKTFEEQYGIVILLDTLGTRGKLYGKNSDEIKGIFEKQKDFIYNFKYKLEWALAERITFDTFTDSTIIVIEIDKTKNDNDIIKILKKIAWITGMFIGYSMNIEMPIRGCFSIGKFYSDDKFVMGEAIDEIGAYYDLSHQWIGVSAAPSAQKIIEAVLKDVDPTNNFIKYNIPLRNSIEIDAWAINWPHILNHIKKNDGSDIDEFANMDSIIDESDTKHLTLDFYFNEGITQEQLDKVMNRNLKNRATVAANLKWRNTRTFFKRSMKKYNGDVKTST